jgi:polyisoprenoid-binding protein YceI
MVGLSLAAISAPAKSSTPTTAMVHDSSAAVALMQEGGLATGTYAIDGVHSSTLFRILHNRVANFYGRFNQIEGSLTWGGEDLSKAKVSVTIPMESVDTNDAKRDEHLRGPDFFNVRRFPKMTFVSTKVEGTPKALQITGTLSLHGVEKELTIPASFTGFAETKFGDRAGFEAKFQIDRTEFGIDAYPDNLGATVDITIALETIKK